MTTLKWSFLILSVPAIAVLFPYSVTHAALRINNSSLVQAQAQAKAQAEAQARAAQSMQPQPARTGGTNNADDDTVVNVPKEQMDACSLIYPSGIFEWAKPTIGVNAGGPATCVALVELRSYQNTGGTEYKVLASEYLAAGDYVKCNVDNFNNFTAAGLDFTYPADNPPTQEDVENVLLQEQRQNAGFKILSAALVGGLGGNLVGKSEDDSMLGTNSEKLKSTAIGAVGAASLMATSMAFNDYTTNKVILSTGVNAAAGAVAGNVNASGDEVLSIVKCSIKKTDENKPTDTECLLGKVSNGSAKNLKSNEKAFYDYKENKIYVCTGKDEEGTQSTNEEQTNKEYDAWTRCRTESLVDIKLADFDLDVGDCDADKIKTKISDKCQKQIKANIDKQDISITTYKFEKEEKPVALSSKTLVEGTDNDKGTMIEIGKDAKIAGSSVRAWIVLSPAWKEEMGNGTFGYTYDDWKKIRDKVKAEKEVYDTRGELLTDVDGKNFEPIYKSADDGDVVDFTNEARTKSTMIGAGGGGVLGAVAGASGANTEINERYLAALREYEDSLGYITCSTGNRYLSKYNDIVIIPEMKVSE